MIPAPEQHFVHRTGWLRAAVLGANDGIVSTSSLVIGVAAASADRFTVLTAGVAGLVAGALSMAAGEYVSVSSQADLERADLAKERRALATEPEAELRELEDIYVARGVERTLARQVAQQLTTSGDLAAHARDELGISELTAPRPIEAALSSAAAFSAGAALPLVAWLLGPAGAGIPVTAVASLVCLAILGALSARAGGAQMLRATARITFWGALAMAVTASVGTLFGVAV